MNNQERIELEIEKKSFQEVVKQFTMHDCDARMEVGLNRFLCEIEDKIKEIDIKLNGT